MTSGGRCCRARSVPHHGYRIGVRHDDWGSPASRFEDGCDWLALTPTLSHGRGGCCGGTAPALTAARLRAGLASSALPDR